MPGAWVLKGPVLSEVGSQASGLMPRGLGTLSAMSRLHFSVVLLAAAVLLVVLAGVTLLPYPSPRINDLAYRSLCPFAPYSSGTLLLAAGLAGLVRSYLNQKR